MGIVNRRNSIVGWLVLKVGKKALRKKAEPLMFWKRGKKA